MFTLNKLRKWYCWHFERNQITSVTYRKHDSYGQHGHIDIVFCGDKYTIRENPNQPLMPSVNDDMNRRWALRQILLGNAKKVVLVG